MFKKIVWFLYDRPVLRRLLIGVGVILSLGMLGIGISILWAVIVGTIINGWNQAIGPMVGKPAITYDQANSLFWFVAALFFTAGLAFGLGKAIFGGGGRSSKR